MKANLIMNFNIDKKNKAINVEREFGASLEKVWDAWTRSEILDQWWAPKPWKTKTKSMDFRAGGYWLYAMTGPEGEAHWCRADYKTVEKLKKFTLIDAFCDENGVIGGDIPRSNWKVSFEGKGQSTMVYIQTTYDKAEDLEKYIEMGFREGFTSAMENLDVIFAS